MAYSDAEKNEAIIRLAQNKYDFKKTSKELGMTVKTLRNWEKNYPKNAIPKLLERAIERMLMHLPDNMKGSDWGIVIGILMDKWLLIQGAPTARIETLISTLQQIPDEELEELERQFTDAARGKAGSS